MVRDFMRTWFPVVLNVTFWISMLIVILGGYSVMKMQTFSGYLFWEGLGVMVAGACGVILVYGCIYVLLDIRDALERQQQ